MFRKNAVLSIGCIALVLLLAQASWGASRIFQPVVSYRSDGWHAVSSAMADVNGDNGLDLLVVNECISGDNCAGGGVLGVLLGNGDGTFQAVHAYDTGGYLATSIAAGDVNGDGKPDLLVGNKCIDVNNCPDGRGVVGVLLGNGDGSFQLTQTYGSGGYLTVSVAVADVNRDGEADVVVANRFIDCDNGCRNNGSVGVLLGNGNGTFQTAQTYDSGGFSTTSLAVGDVNRDGKPDVVVGHEDTRFHRRSTVSVLLGNGDGAFQTAQTYNSGGFRVSSIAVNDVNGDSRPDLLVTNLGVRTNNYPNGIVSVRLGIGDGTFEAARTFHSGGTWATSLAVGDVNSDGKPDLLVADTSGLRAWLGNGDGTFQLGGSDPAYGSSITVNDVNGDGRPDVTVAEACFPNDCTEGAVGVLLNAIPFTTTTDLGSSLNPSVYGQAVRLRAAVTSTGPNEPTGLVRFWSGSTAIGTAELIGGIARLTKTNLPVGSLSITAKYQGDRESAKSVSPVFIEVVNPASTTTIIESSANPSVEGQPVTFTAKVTSPTARVTGTVTFTAGTTTLGTVTLSGGKAILTTSALPQGNNTITATFDGTANIIGSAASLTQTVN